MRPDVAATSIRSRTVTQMCKTVVRALRESAATLICSRGTFAVYDCLLYRIEQRPICGMATPNSDIPETWRPSMLSNLRRFPEGNVASSGFYQLQTLLTSLLRSNSLQMCRPYAPSDFIAPSTNTPASSPSSSDCWSPEQRGIRPGDTQSTFKQTHKGWTLPTQG